MADTCQVSETQLRFCEAYVLGGGKNATDAYLEAYPKSSKAAARASASDLLTKPNIIATIESLRKPRTKAVVLTLERKRELLLQFAEDESAEIRDRIKSISEDAKIAGDYASDKSAAVVADAFTELLDHVRKPGSPFGQPRL